MEHTWYCPNCGRRLVLRRREDNATGRERYTIGCVEPGHYATRAYPDPITAEQALVDAFGSC